MNYNEELNSNNTELQEILNTINELPEGNVANLSDKTSTVNFTMSAGSTLQDVLTAIETARAVRQSVNFVKVSGYMNVDRLIAIKFDGSTTTGGTYRILDLGTLQTWSGTGGYEILLTDIFATSGLQTTAKTIVEAINELNTKKLDESQLGSAVETALAEAKASGEFDGADGASVTVTNVTESTADGGSNVVTFSDGNTVTIKNGSKGSDGKDGATGAKGANGKSAYQYAKGGGYTGTETEFAEDINPDNIKADNIAFISTELAKRGQLKPEFAQTIEECTDTTKLYVLPNGYIYAYMYTEVVEGGYKNLLAEAVGTDGAIYNGRGYKNGARLSSSGAESTLAGAFLTGFIPVKVGETLYLNGNYIKTDWASAGSANTFFYDADFKRIDSSATPMGSFVSGAAFIDVVTNDEGYVTQFTMNPNWTYYSNWHDLAYIRMTLIGTGSGCVIANAPIVEGEIVKKYAWTNTGHAFVPNDYDSEFVELAQKINNNSVDINELKIANEDLENRLVSCEKGIQLSVPTYWETAIATAKAKIAEIQALGGVNCVSFVWASDIHASVGIDERGKRFGIVAKAIMDEADIPLFVVTGDLMSQSSHASTTNVYNELALVKKWLSPIPYYQQALIMGNHDGAWGDTTSGHYYKQLSLDIMYNLIYRKQAMDFRRVSGDNGTYYYIDNESQKVRYIMLNTNNTPSYAENADGTAKYDRFHASCLGQIQLDWFSNVALDMPEGYTACIFGHEPYPGDYPQMVGIVDAYNNKGTYNNTYTDSANAWRNSTVNVNFASAKGEIAAVFAGHTHIDAIRHIGNNPMYLTCPLIITPNSLGGEVRDGTTRMDGTDTEFAMDIVTVDTKNRKIYMTRLGAGIDREIGY